MKYDDIMNGIWNLNSNFSDNYDTAILQVAVDLVKKFPPDINVENSTEELRKKLAIEINKITKLLRAL